MANTNVYWLVSQMGKDDIRALTMPLLMVEDTLELAALTFDVFMHSVEALSDASHSRKHGIVDQTLHSLPLPSYHQGKDTHDPHVAQCRLILLKYTKRL
jgi:Iap family predicted aminopeptidase